MKFYVITIFPDFIELFSNFGVVGRAAKNRLLDIKAINLREFADSKYRQTDDKPYGGGPGMIMKPEPLYHAISSVRNTDSNVKVALLTPQGKEFTQSRAEEFFKLDSLCLVCGRYEGFDERIKKMVDFELSIGRYVLSGGEIAACAVIDATARLIPGVLGNSESLAAETYGENSEYPQYTRPAVFKGMRVPEILLSGNHEKIKKWIEEHSIKGDLK
ncbi:MAG TPA: tRNA (guanosine(37)-N1)-methyltransferase TrmD [Deltaproteobacteria bacterium]|nr:MAG: tRNA (guanine-N(1)-)-methyltransferase [bacterium]HDH10524.1 tRNA (guanosine(37)-N1)-methyltransferase TrmD [Deltaproteobacteria bacterium]